MANKIKPVTHCLFDMDGTLLDTETIYEKIISDIAKSFKKELPMELRLKIMGTTEQRTAEIIVSELSLPITPQEFVERFQTLGKKRVSRCKMKPGVERLLRHLDKHKIPFCMATSSSASMVELKISNHREVFKLFHHFVCGSSDPKVKQGKPAPDIFLIAASRFPDNPVPTKCLVFEDAPNGVKAAIAACMRVVMIPDTFVAEEYRQLATQCLNSLEEFQPELYSLPPFDDDTN